MKPKKERQGGGHETPRFRAEESESRKIQKNGDRRLRPGAKTTVELRNGTGGLVNYEEEL